MSIEKAQQQEVANRILNIVSQLTGLQAYVQDTYGAAAALSIITAGASEEKKDKWKQIASGFSELHDLASRALSDAEMLKRELEDILPASTD